MIKTGIFHKEELYNMAILSKKKRK